MAENGTAVSTSVPEKARVVGVRFRQAGKIYYFDPGDKDYRVGDRVLVEVEDGLEVGEVAIQPKVLPSELVVWPLRPVVRLLNDEDTGSLQQRREAERHALQVASERAAALGLNMRFVSAEMAFDGSRVRLFFVSEERVDFRQLVRDLAGRLRTRVELRQIGVRDKAKLVGGIGDCGRELCCATWMAEFQPVSIRMAKVQNLSLNPSRLSGQCGRLNCCLRYEDEMYRELFKGLPKVGTTLMTPQGPGRVVEVLPLKESVLVDLGEGRRLVVKATDLEQVAENGAVTSDHLEEVPGSEEEEKEEDEVAAAGISGGAEETAGAGEAVQLAAEAEADEVDADEIPAEEVKAEAEVERGTEGQEGAPPRSRPSRRRSRRSRSARARRAGVEAEDGHRPAPASVPSPAGAAEAVALAATNPPSSAGEAAAGGDALASRKGKVRRRRRRRRPPRQEGAKQAGTEG